MMKWLTGASAVLHNGRCDSLKGRNGGRIYEVCPLGKASMLVVDEAKVLDIPIAMVEETMIGLETINKWLS